MIIESQQKSTKENFLKIKNTTYHSIYHQDKLKLMQFKEEHLKTLNVLTEKESNMKLLNILFLIILFGFFVLNSFFFWRHLRSKWKKKRKKEEANRLTKEKLELDKVKKKSDDDYFIMVKEFLVVISSLKRKENEISDLMLQYRLIHNCKKELRKLTIIEPVNEYQENAFFSLKNVIKYLNKDDFSELRRKLKTTNINSDDFKVLTEYDNSSVVTKFLERKLESVEESMSICLNKKDRVFKILKQFRIKCKDRIIKLYVDKKKNINQIKEWTKMEKEIKKILYTREIELRNILNRNNLIDSKNFISQKFSVVRTISKDIKIVKFNDSDEIKTIKIIELNSHNLFHLDNEIKNIANFNHKFIIKNRKVWILKDINRNIKVLGLELENKVRKVRNSKTGVTEYESEMLCDYLHWLKKIDTEKKIRLCEESNKRTDKEIKIITKKILEAIIYLHKNSVVIEHLRPSNILVTRDNDIKICCLKYARNEIGKVILKAPETEELYSNGTIYSPPNNFKSYNIDLHSFGILLKNSLNIPLSCEKLNWNDTKKITQEKFFKGKWEEFELLEYLLSLDEAESIFLLDKKSKKALGFDFFNIIEDDNNSCMKASINERKIKYIKKNAITLMRKTDFVCSKTLKIDRNKVLKLKKQIIEYSNSISKQKNKIDENEKLNVHEKNNAKNEIDKELANMKKRFRRKCSKFCEKVAVYIEEEIKDLKDLVANLKINFVGEKGSDYGGVYREFLSFFFQCLEKSKFVDIDKETNKYYLPTDKKLYSKFFKSLGKLMMKIVLTNHNADIKFGHFVYNFFVDNLPITFIEWGRLAESYCPSEYRSIDWGLKRSDETLKNTFESMGNRSSISYFKSKIEKWIIGEKYRKENLVALKEGFFSLVPENFLSKFKFLNGLEINEIIQGKDGIDGKYAERFIVFPDYKETQSFLKTKKMVDILQTIGSLNHDELLKFWRFATGLSGLSGDGTDTKIRVYLTKDNGIRSQTCSYTLLIGDGFSSYTRNDDPLGFWFNLKASFEECGMNTL